MMMRWNEYLIQTDFRITGRVQGSSSMYVDLILHSATNSTKTLGQVCEHQREANEQIFSNSFIAPTRSCQFSQLHRHALDRAMASPDSPASPASPTSPLVVSHPP